MYTFQNTSLRLRLGSPRTNRNFPKTNRNRRFDELE
jgi:hypothetical protein